MSGGIDIGFEGGEVVIHECVDFGHQGLHGQSIYFVDGRAPHILHSDNGREFSNKVIKEVLAMWPECKLVHGKPRYSQSQGSVERANRDVKAILACWMKDNNTTQWSNGLRFVQWQKNTRFLSGIGRTPYEAMYGEKAHLGISPVNIPEEIMEGM
ncbi:KRAB-A domain-containing protein 2-like [Palaemon carinicauda]|uniref:KRAB-A domain-containing protein 2-like n=1 Tax=Palaemon carinicauda TaxID=392227 RepID=UPI0035B64EE7